MRQLPRTTRSPTGTSRSSSSVSAPCRRQPASLTHWASTRRWSSCSAKATVSASRLGAAPACTPTESATSAGDPISVDLSAGMLRHAHERLPVVQGDACRVPVATAVFDAVITVMAHTDLPDYLPVLGEIYRALKPGGLFVHIGVHPCFCGGFANRSEPDRVVIRPGYLDGSWTTESWTDQGIRDKVGASHLPMAELINIVLGTGFRLERVTEGGRPTPIVLSLKCRKAGPDPWTRRVRVTRGARFDRASAAAGRNALDEASWNAGPRTCHRSRSMGATAMPSARAPT